MRSFSKQAYTSGVVIIKCPECGSRHLIADRLGWFGDNASVETILKEKGQGECYCCVPSTASLDVTAVRLFVTLFHGSLCAVTCCGDMLQTSRPVDRRRQVA